MGIKNCGISLVLVSTTFLVSWHSYSPPTSGNLHVIQTEHWLANHVWNFKHNLKFPSAISHMLFDLSISSLKSFSPTSTLLPPSSPSLPKTPLRQSVQRRAPAALLHWPTWQTDITLSAEPDGKGVMCVWGGLGDTNSLWAPWVQWQLEWSVSIATVLHCHLVDRGRRCTASTSHPVSELHLCLTSFCHFPLSSSLH